MKRNNLISVLIIILLGIGLLSLTGCGTKIHNTDNTNNNSNSISKKDEETNLKIGNVSVDLNRSGSFHDISYKYPENALSSNVGTYAIMDLMNNGDLVVRIAMYFYENKAMGEVNAGAGLSSVDAIEYNNNTWNVYEGIKDGKRVMNYATQEGDDSYTITFLSNDDVAEFSNEFMKKVLFNR